MFDTLCRSEFVGVVTLLDSLFLNANNNATIFMEAYQTTLKISHDAVRMLNHIANVDCVRFQNTLGGARDSHAESGAASVRNTVKRSSAVSGYEASVLQNEFYHLVQFWLNTWMRDHAKAKAAVAMAQTDASGNVVNGSRDSTSPGAKRLRTSLLHEVILLIGFYVQGSSKNQQLVRIGQYPVILQQLTSLPFHYFCMPG